VKLSIIIPVFNEKNTFLAILDIVKKAPLPKEIKEREIVIVDDCSTDGTRDILAGIKDKNVKIFYHEKNAGKGAALQTGFRQATGDVVLIQDADMEYDPNEYPKLLKPIVDGKADVVYGSRFMGGEPHRVLYFWHMLGNKMLTLLSNMFSDLNLTDMETCYKVIKKSVLDQFELEEKRFGIEPEMTAKIGELSRTKGVRVFEVGISYYGRTYEEGKKIGLKDAFRALWCIFKYNTSRFAHLVKYAINGIFVALSQYASIIALVESFGMRSMLQQNIAHAISIEISIIVGFVLHSFLGWRYRFTSVGQLMLKVFQFHFITGISVAMRLVLFYSLSATGMDYKLNTIIGIVVAIVWNFLGYDRIVFKEKYKEIHPGK